MKALILNSGTGSRMGELTAQYPKCMTQVLGTETILSRQLQTLVDMGIEEVVITTGRFAEKLTAYCNSLKLPLQYTFIHNSEYADTNYVFSIYLARRMLENTDLLLFHGDLVFEYAVLEQVLVSEESCMVTSTTQKLPEKDFKAVIRDRKIVSVGVEFFREAVAAQPLYYLKKKDWSVWLSRIVEFCEAGKCKVYAEAALNEVTESCKIYPLDIKDYFCMEVDTPEDLKAAKEKIARLKDRTVYMCFSADMIHSGHIAIIKKAAKYGRLTIGVLSDEAVVSYKRFPLLPFQERKALFESIIDVDRVVIQDELSYRRNLEQYKPDIVVHGDDWREGFQKPVRKEVLSILASYGGRLVEFPYMKDERYVQLEQRARLELSLPDVRRRRLKQVLQMKGLISVIEAHNGLTGLIAEKTVVQEEGKTYQFDAMWVSSLCDSTAKGKPDIELVDMTSRLRTIDDIMEVTTKPIIFDGDTGGLIEHFVYTVRTLERMGVSMIIIEDKTGLKKNSLFGTQVEQTQDSIEHFAAKIRAGKQAQKTTDFMIVARIESLILEKGMKDAIDRAFAFVQAGADGIMIHSRRREPDEIFEFVRQFREKDETTPIVVVPTSYHSVTEEELKRRGVNVVIYANQLIRSAFPAMQETAKTILKHHRAMEADAACMSIKDILTLIPEE